MKFRLALIAVFLLSLPACYKRHTTDYIYVKPPSSLVTYPCVAEPPGTTLNELATAYVSNLGCIRSYETQTELLLRYMESIGR